VVAALENLTPLNKNLKQEFEDHVSEDIAMPQSTAGVGKLKSNKDIKG